MLISSISLFFSVPFVWNAIVFCLPWKTLFCSSIVWYIVICFLLCLPLPLQNNICDKTQMIKPYLQDETLVCVFTLFLPLRDSCFQSEWSRIHFSLARQGNFDFLMRFENVLNHLFPMIKKVLYPYNNMVHDEILASLLV